MLHASWSVRQANGCVTFHTEFTLCASDLINADTHTRLVRVFTVEKLHRWTFTLRRRYRRRRGAEVPAAAPQRIHGLERCLGHRTRRRSHRKRRRIPAVLVTQVRVAGQSRSNQILASATGGKWVVSRLLRVIQSTKLRTLSARRQLPGRAL